MTLVLPTAGASPGTHVLIVGVGRYPHLVDGRGPLFAGHEGMGQLSSPPTSARALATWFLMTYSNPERPLASVDLLVSGDDDQFVLPDGGRVTIAPATFANVDSAVNDWKTRGDTDARNLMIFYFCGHGMASGLQSTLLMEDFGSVPHAALRQAIDINGLHLGMDKCAARDQCYFVDACRRSSGELLRTATFTGDPIIPGERSHARIRRRAPIYYATLPGTEAYGRRDAPSFYTEALLKALDGAGSDDADGSWTIKTDVLNTGVGHLLDRGVRGTAAVGQLVSVDHLSRFPLHWLQGRPLVPVDVECDPDRCNPHAVLSYAAGGGERRRERPAAECWGIEVEEGSYRFAAELQPPEHGTGSVEKYVGPPYRLVRIEVRA